MMLQEMRCYDKGNWVVVREKDRRVVHRTNSNAAAHSFADKVTKESNEYHYVDEEEDCMAKSAIEAAGGIVQDGE